MAEATGAPDISFVVPAYQEAQNLPHLVNHIREGLGSSGLSWELIVANDESGDGTVAVCELLARDHPVVLLNRTEDRGLSQAVIAGVKIARGEHLVVMDADMSHPSELVPDMIGRLQSGSHDFVLGSRYVNQASTDENWPLSRRLGSMLATAVAQPLVKVRDPMAGYFALRRADWPTTELNPVGYKIALELLVRGGLARKEVCELPIHFTDRKYGKSKMGARELMNYLHHVMRLYRFRWPALRMAMHFAVGCLGLLVDIGTYLLLVLLGVPHLTSRLLSFWPATISNWWLNRVTTYDDRPKRSMSKQFSLFVLATLFGFAVNSTIYYYLTANVAWFDEHKLVALVLGVAVGFVLNFAGSNLLVYRDLPKSSS